MPDISKPISLAELLKQFHQGQVTVRAHAEQVIEKAAEQAGLGAVLSLDEEELRAAAGAADTLITAGRARPLEGALLALKDNIDTASLPTTGGTAALTGPAAADAPALARLAAAGAVAAAKTNLHELAFGITSNNGCKGPVRNPWNTSLIAGGSSGGTAAAIAGGILPAGLGTDTGGSVRIPAALCGITGFRPSSGRYPAGGVVPISSTRDTIGPMGRTVADIALLDSFMAGKPASLPDQPVPESALPGLRLGVPRRILWEGLEPGVADVCERLLQRLATAGVQLIEADPADLWEDAGAASFPIALYEVMQELPAYVGARGVGFDDLLAAVGSADVKAILESQQGEAAIPEAAWQAALHTHRPAMLKNWAAYFAEHQLDAALFPTTPLTARPLGEDETVTLNGVQTPTFQTFIRNTDHGSVIGAPGISLPAGLSDGLPVGIELDGLPGQDSALLAAAAAIETVLEPLSAP